VSALAADVIVLSLAAGADQASTAYAMHRGAVEANPLMREPAAAVAIKAAGIAGTALACQHLRKTGHTRAAKVLRWTVAAVWMGIAARNVHVGRQVGGAR